MRRLEISFSQGAEWNALISTYIGAIPLSGDASCAAEQSVFGESRRTFRHFAVVCPRISRHILFIAVLLSQGGLS